MVLSATPVVYFLDNEFRRQYPVDCYQSLIWTSRYNQGGDFELSIAANAELYSEIKKYPYAMIEESDTVMCVEELELTTDSEESDILLVSGRDLAASILSRRVLWGQTVITGKLQDSVRKLLNWNIISPSITERKIPNFTMKDSSDPVIVSGESEEQYFCENLFKVISELCEKYELGFRLVPKIGGALEFELYNGTNRAFSQTAVPPVVFSDDYGNLLSSRHLFSKKEYCNSAIVAAGGTGFERPIHMVSKQDFSGLDRYEIYVNASDITNDPSGLDAYENYSYEERLEIARALDQEYATAIREKGLSALSESAPLDSFDGEIDPEVQFVYGIDFFLGDVVQISNKYGAEAETRVSEVIISSDQSGVRIVPTFTLKE